MTILCDKGIVERLWDGLVAGNGIDMSLVNPASLDIRVGRHVIRERAHGRWGERELLPREGLLVEPGEFLLVDTWEEFNVPNGYALDLRLKSSTARKGWNHNLAGWVDPGWRGVLTMELKNMLQYNTLKLTPGQRFAQVSVHQLSGPSDSPYAGRYNHAQGVEAAKD